jgi:hypothetical protein
MRGCILEGTSAAAERAAVNTAVEIAVTARSVQVVLIKGLSTPSLQRESARLWQARSGCQ